MKTNKLTSFTFLITLISFAIAQEPYDINPWGKGIISKEEAEEIEREWHFPIKITFQVIDEEGEAVPDANVNVGIGSRLHMDGYNNHKGKTNQQGIFTVESEGTGAISTVEKQGYYSSEPEIRWNGEKNNELFANDKKHLKEIGLQPWNPTIPVILKKIGKPIPMIVRIAGGKLSRTAPNLKDDIGFDMIEYDWVAPYGKGKVEDFRIRFIPDLPDEDKNKSTAKLHFVNPDDGLIPIPELTGGESQLRFPRTAPEKGYDIKHLDLMNYAGQYPVKPPIGYFLRIRTVKDEATGEIVSAQYGKIVDPRTKWGNPFEIQIYFDKEKSVPGAAVYYSSYINPTPNDRNLEYDQKNNLAPNLPELLHGVTWPP